MHLKTRAAAALDTPHLWSNYLRPWFDIERHQRQIDQRIGLSRTGRSIIRLQWAQDVRFTIWDEDTPRYWLKRRINSDGSKTYWTVARWVYEIRNEPETYTSAWNATRYALRDPTTGGGFTCEDCGHKGDPKLIAGKLYCTRCVGTNVIGGSVIDKGPPPTDYYTYLMDASVHEAALDRNGRAACCVRAMYSDTKWGKSGMRCWGEYRPPGDLDLAVISRLASNMEANKARDMYREISPAELAELELTSNMQVEAEAERFAAYEQEIIDDFNRLHGWRRTETDPGALHHGRFHDLGKSRRVGKESGIVVDNQPEGDNQ